MKPRYDEAPDKVHKQYNVGYINGIFWQVSKQLGDLYIPTACPGGIAAVKDYETRRIQPLPWSTSMNGYPMTFVEFCFSGSNTYGKATDGNGKATDGKWYLIEEMQVIGTPDDSSIGGTWRDLVRYTDEPVCEVAPPAVIGWKREQ